MNRMILCAVVAIACMALCSTSHGQDYGDETLSAFLIGNGYQVGGGVGLTGKYTTVGIDARYLEEYGDENEETAVISAFVSWNAIPKLTLPVGGLLPWLDLPAQSVDVQLNLIGRLGWELENHDVVATVGAELELLTGDRASIAIRYEYAFEDEVWSQLADGTAQHQAMLYLKYKIK